MAWRRVLTNGVLLPRAQAFVTHFYNFYFAHTAGGMSIGKKVMDGSFEGHMFDFYQWYEPSGEPANVKALLQASPPPPPIHNLHVSRCTLCTGRSSSWRRTCSWHRTCAGE